MIGSKIDLSILVVGYNSATFLPPCLTSVSEAIDSRPYEILFVNNGTDNSEELVSAAFPAVKVLPSRGNVGFAAGNDYLADHAVGKWLLLLNPDTRLYSGALATLLETAEENPQFAVFGGVTVSQDGTPEARAELELPNLATLLRGLVGWTRRVGADDPTGEVLPVDALSGGFMMVRHDCWKQLGGLDKSFFLYAEELDFFKRLKDAGGRAAQVSAQPRLSRFRKWRRLLTEPHSVHGYGQCSLFSQAFLAAICVCLHFSHVGHNDEALCGRTDLGGSKRTLCACFQRFRARGAGAVDLDVGLQFARFRSAQELLISRLGSKQPQRDDEEDKCKM